MSRDTPAGQSPPRDTGRRRFLLIGAVTVAGLGTGLGLLTKVGPTPRSAVRAGTALPGTMASQARYLQIVAHEDDDLLFMAPDLIESLRAGSAHLTVYLSAGESRAGVAPDTHDVDAYVAERQAGVRAAYALMLGVPDRWHRQTLMAGPLRLPSYTLADRPDIRLAFFQLPDGRDPRAGLGWHTLTTLWSADHRPDLCGWTQERIGSPFRRCVSREEILAALVGLAERFRPTVIRAQDPVPDQRYAADHLDHVAAALFAGEAARRYALVHTEDLVLQVNYRDYGVRDLAANLRREDRRFKQRVFAAYAAHDYRIDFANPHWGAYEARMAHRWPRGTGFATADAVYAVAAHGLVAWRRSDEHWTERQALGDPGGPLAPAVHAAGSHVLGLRSDTGEIVAHGPAGWTSLGRPDPGNIRNQAGTPVAAVDGAGMLVVFTRNGRGGVSARFLGDDGAWSHRWTDLPGVDLRQIVLPSPRNRRSGHDAHPPPRRYGDVQDGLAVVVSDTGLIELFAATRAHLLWWRQEEAGKPLVLAGAPPTPAGPIAPLFASYHDGRVRVSFREPGTGQVLEISRSVTDDTWTPALTVPSVRGLDGEPPITGSPPRPSGQLIGSPASLPDGTGLCALGADGRLYVAARSGTRTAWREAGR